jgi:hypothetical protein
MCDPFGFEVGATREIQTPTASFGQVFDSLLGEQPTRARRWLASKFLYFPPDPHQHGSLRPIFGVMTDLSGDQVRRGKADKFTRCDDLSLLPEFRKMPAISSDEVISPGFVGVFQKSVVVWISAQIQAARWCDDMAAVLDELEQLQAEPLADAQLRA